MEDFIANELGPLTTIKNLELLVKEDLYDIINSELVTFLIQKLVDCIVLVVFPDLGVFHIAN